MLMLKTRSCYFRPSPVARPLPPPGSDENNELQIDVSYRDVHGSDRPSGRSKIMEISFSYTLQIAYGYGKTCFVVSLIVVHYA